MKKIEGIIKPHRLDMVKAALARFCVEGITVTEVRGFARDRGHVGHYRGAEYVIDFTPMVKIEIVLADEEIDDAVQIIRQAARTGEIGDGKVFVVNVEEVVRIRTGETGEVAI